MNPEPRFFCRPGFRSCAAGVEEGAAGFGTVWGRAGRRMMRNGYGVPGKKDGPECRVVSGRGRRAGRVQSRIPRWACSPERSCPVVAYRIMSGIGIGRGLSCLFSGTGVGAGFIPGSLWNVVGFIFVFGLILSAVLRRKEAESCSDEGMKKPPYIRMYGGLRAETAKVIPSVS